MSTSNKKGRQCTLRTGGRRARSVLHRWADRSCKFKLQVVIRPETTKENPCLLVFPCFCPFPLFANLGNMCSSRKQMRKPRKSHSFPSVFNPKFDRVHPGDRPPSPPPPRPSSPRFAAAPQSAARRPRASSPRRQPGTTQGIGAADQVAGLGWLRVRSSESE